MDLTFTPREEQFRADVRAWLAAVLPPDWNAPTSAAPRTYAELVELRRWWDRTLFEGGYAGLAWPREYGGRGATLVEQVIFYEEIARVRAPEELGRTAKLLLGPTLIEHGTEAQKRRFLPRILTGDEIWCQGFSEPNAGSDLASLQTRADLDGDVFVVNGQKTWTSYADLADWVFMLVRTDRDAPKHRGITFLMAPMSTPGISIRPIRQMTGSAEFSEVFFDNVRVPAANVLGSIDDGWRVAMTALNHERGTLGFYRQVLVRGEFDELVALAKVVSRDGRPAIEVPRVREQLARLRADLDMFRWLLYRYLTRQIRGELAGAEGSIVKVCWSEMYQRIGDLSLEILGPLSLAADGPHAVECGRWQHRALKSRGDTIHSGTNEIQRNLIGERILGLPRSTA